LTTRHSKLMWVSDRIICIYHSGASQKNAKLGLTGCQSVGGSTNSIEDLTQGLMQGTFRGRVRSINIKMPAKQMKPQSFSALSSIIEVRTRVYWYYPERQRYDLQAHLSYPPQQSTRNGLHILLILRITIIVSFFPPSFFALSPPLLAPLLHSPSNLHTDLIEACLRIQGAKALEWKPPRL
jgi:hypothetical protein